MYTVWAALYVCLHPPVSLNGNRVCLDEDTLRSGENHKLGTYRCHHRHHHRACG